MLRLNQKFNQLNLKIMRHHQKYYGVKLSLPIMTVELEC
jgi:hypothetical protein